MIDFDSNVCLVYKVFNRNFSELQYIEGDLIQEGMMGLWRACQAFDASKGVAFSTYATKCIFRAMRDFARKEQRHARNVLSLDSMIDPEKSDDTFVALLGVEDTEEIDAKIMLDEVLEKLRRTGAWDIVQMKLEGMTQAEIARELGVSEAAVSERLSAAYKKVRES